MRVAELRSTAKAKREMASVIRRATPGLSLAEHRELFRRHAEDLEADAAMLEGQAASLEGAASGGLSGVCLSVWTIYDSPKHRPARHRYVARRFEIQRGNGEPVATDETISSPYLDVLRRDLEKRGHVRLASAERDGPHIMENWV